MIWQDWKNFLFCSEGAATTPSKTHSFYWLNRPNRSQHSTKECPLLFTQINRYTHWQRPKDTNVLVLIWYDGCSSLKPPGKGKGSRWKRKSQYLLCHQLHSPLLSDTHVAFVRIPLNDSNLGVQGLKGRQHSWEGSSSLQQIASELVGLNEG